MHEQLPQLLMDQLVASLEDHEKLSVEIFESLVVRNRFVRLISRMLVN